MDIRKRSLSSLFDPIIFTPRAEFRYSTYNSEKKPIGKEKVQRETSSQPQIFRRKNSRRLHKEPNANALIITAATNATIAKPAVSFNSRSLSKLAKEYYLDSKRRLSSFSRKSWHLSPPEEKTNPKQLGLEEQAKKETKYMMKALLEILEDYTREVLSQHNCKTACAMSPNQSKNYDEKPRMLPFTVSKHILRRCKELCLPSCKDQLRRLLRPLIYLDVQRKGTRRVRTIVIELYTEACPEVVLEFVRHCSQNDNEAFRFQRSFPALWIEAGLKLNCDKVQNDEIEYDMRALDHGATSGILSFPARYVHGFCRNNFEFSLSVDSLPNMRRSRVAFGVVIAGLNFLDDMQIYDMKYCDHIQDYKVVQCGLVVR